MGFYGPPAILIQIRLHMNCGKFLLRMRTVKIEPIEVSLWRVIKTGMESNEDGGILKGRKVYLLFIIAERLLRVSPQQVQ